MVVVVGAHVGTCVDRWMGRAWLGPGACQGRRVQGMQGRLSATVHVRVEVRACAGAQSPRQSPNCMYRQRPHVMVRRRGCQGAADTPSGSMHVFMEHTAGPRVFMEHTAVPSAEARGGCAVTRLVNGMHAPSGAVPPELVNGLAGLATAGHAPCTMQRTGPPLPAPNSTPQGSPPALAPARRAYCSCIS